MESTNLGKFFFDIEFNKLPLHLCDHVAVTVKIQPHRTITPRLGFGKLTQPASVFGVANVKLNRGAVQTGQSRHFNRSLS